MVSTLKELRGTVKNLRRFGVEGSKDWSAFNPSIAYSDKHGFIMTVRSSNYVILEHGELHVMNGGPIRNKIMVARLSSDLDFESMHELVYDCGRPFPRGIEDAKLLWRDSKLFFTGVAMERDIRVARQCECWISDDLKTVTEFKLLGGIDPKRPEKNWMTAAKKPANFDYIYDGNGVIVGDRVVRRFQIDERLSGLRGNTHLIEQADGTYLGIMHKLYTTKKKMYDARRFGIVDGVLKDYHHFFVRFDADGWAVEVSKPFQFVSPGIEFAAGLLEKDGHYVISFGKNDASSHIAIIENKHVKKIMERVRQS